jgi:phage terminase large subunit-like protein
LDANFRKALEIPAYENTFRRLHLNQWTEQATRWLPMDLWDEGATPPIDLDWFAGRECFGGLDLASVSDLTSFCLNFLDKDTSEHRALWWHWIPSEGARRREQRDRVPYLTWEREGFINLTDGNVADYDAIRKQINEIGQRFKIREIAYDRWNAQQLVTQLEGDGYTMVPTGMGYASLTAPSKYFEGLVTARKFRHGGNPVARWCASNVSAEQDPAGNLKPSRKRSTEKIDAIVSLILALSRAVLQREDEGSVYQHRGILMLR